MRSLLATAAKSSLLIWGLTLVIIVSLIGFMLRTVDSLFPEPHGRPVGKGW